MIRSFLRRALVVGSVYTLPLVAVAATAPTDFKGLAKLAVDLLNAATVLAVGLGVLYYLWGVASSIKDGGSAKGWEKFRTQVVWGLIALFVMFSIWGILRILTNTLFKSYNGASFIT